MSNEIKIFRTELCKIQGPKHSPQKFKYRKWMVKKKNKLGSSHGLYLYRSMSAMIKAGSGRDVILFCK